MQTGAVSPGDNVKLVTSFMLTKNNVQDLRYHHKELCTKCISRSFLISRPYVHEYEATLFVKRPIKNRFAAYTSSYALFSFQADCYLPKAYASHDYETSFNCVLVIESEESIKPTEITLTPPEACTFSCLPSRVTLQCLQCHLKIE